MDLLVQRISIRKYKKQYEQLSSKCSPFQRYSVITSVCNCFYSLRFKSYTRHYAVMRGGGGAPSVCLL